MKIVIKTIDYTVIKLASSKNTYNNELFYCLKNNLVHIYNHVFYLLKRVMAVIFTIASESLQTKYDIAGIKSPLLLKSANFFDV